MLSPSPEASLTISALLSSFFSFSSAFSSAFTGGFSGALAGDFVFVFAAGAAFVTLAGEGASDSRLGIRAGLAEAEELKNCRKNYF